jgi:hypothetical protein
VGWIAASCFTCALSYILTEESKIEMLDQRDAKTNGKI